jgi:outer membrane protein OmpA-like peptidoglycan-associated protein
MRNILWILILSLFSSALIGQQTDRFQVKRLKKIKKKVRQNLNGFEVKIKNVRYRGRRRAIGEFWNGSSIFQMSHGIVLSTGIAQTAEGSNNDKGKTGVNRRKGLQVFKTVTNEKLYDAAVLQFYFYPNSDYISFNFVFASEDYPEFIASGYNDVLAFILTLPSGEKINLAKLPNSQELVSVASINPIIHPQYYINNSQQEIPTISSELDTFLETNSTHQMLLTRSWNTQKASTSTSKYPIQFDGFTKVLKAQYPVLANQKYRLQIAIADNGNSIFDSAVFIEMESLNSHKEANFQTGILKKEPNYYYQIDTLSITRIQSFITENPSKSAICFKQPADLLFDYDSPTLSQLNQSLLNNLGQQLQQCLDLNLKIRGYAAAEDNKSYNRKLSRERAERVKVYLMELGVESDRIDVNWQGDGVKATKSELTQNRRVKLEVFAR